MIYQFHHLLVVVLLLIVVLPRTTNSFTIIHQSATSSSPLSIVTQSIYNQQHQHHYYRFATRTSSSRSSRSSSSSTAVLLNDSEDAIELDINNQIADNNESESTTKTSSRKIRVIPKTTTTSKQESTAASASGSPYEVMAEANRQRAIKNKKSNEPTQDKKRRLLMFMKQQQISKKRANRVLRPIPINDRNCTLADIIVVDTSIDSSNADTIEQQKQYNGTVVSITNFGAYVDIGTEVDGLLHVSQLSRTKFIEHPKQLLQLGQSIMVTVRSVSIEKKKMHLSLLPIHIIRKELLDEQQQKLLSKQLMDNEQTDDDNDNDNDTDSNIERRIQLNEFEINDEVWGIIQRVTDYGAYIEIGAVVNGFLHYMDHPQFIVGYHPSDFIFINTRVRLWISNIDTTLNRIKVTAIRPNNLPGPRRI